MTRFFVALCALSLLGCITLGCATKRITSQEFVENKTEVETFDSLAYYRQVVDSFAQASVRRDSVVIRDSIIIYKDSAGNTINREYYHSSDAWRFMESDLSHVRIDDLDAFRLRLTNKDSLSVERSREKVVKTQYPQWLRIFFIVFVFCVSLIYCYKIYRMVT